MKASTERREAGANRGPLGPGVPRAPGPRRHPAGAIRYLPQQPLSLALPKPTVGSQAFRASGRAAVAGFARRAAAWFPARLCPAGAQASGWKWTGQCSTPRDERLQVALSDPEPCSFSCAWRDFVSACLCPVCVRRSSTPQLVCTFSVSPENRLERVLDGDYETSPGSVEEFKVRG